MIFRRAVTGMIHPTPDIYQPLLFVLTRIFPNQHHPTGKLKKCGTGHRLTSVNGIIVGFVKGWGLHILIEA